MERLYALTSLRYSSIACFASVKHSQLSFPIPCLSISVTSPLGQLQPAVVLMDIHLRRTMDGITATRLIKAQYPGVAILGLSWDTSEYVVSAMQQAGALEVLPKEQQTLTDDWYGAIQRAIAADQ